MVQTSLSCLPRFCIILRSWSNSYKFTVTLKVKYIGCYRQEDLRIDVLRAIGDRESGRTLIKWGAINSRIPSNNSWNINDVC